MNAIHERALAAIETSDPALAGIRRAAECISFSEEKTILHAGPPLRKGPVSKPIYNSACVAAVDEGWASDFDDAGRRIESGAIRLAPGQDANAMVPLAPVRSPGMGVREGKRRL